MNRPYRGIYYHDHGGKKAGMARLSESAWPMIFSLKWPINRGLNSMIQNTNCGVSEKLEEDRSEMSGEEFVTARVSHLFLH